MRKLFFLFVSLFLLIGCTQAPEVAKKSAFKKLLLWEATKGDSHIYLFGTMHSAHPLFQKIPPKLAKAIDVSDAVYTEVDMGLMGQVSMVKMMMRNDGKRLGEVLPKKLYTQLESYILTRNPRFSLKQFDSFKTWSLLSLLVSLDEMVKYPDNKPFDDIVFAFADSRNKEVGGIEQVEEQAKLFEGFSEEEQISMVRETLQSLQKEPELQEVLYRVYIAGDQQKMLKFVDRMMMATVKSKKLQKRLEQTFLYERNQKMATRIDALVQKNPTKRYLFAFGAMHFLDKRSVLEYLKQMGYSIQAVE